MIRRILPTTCDFVEWVKETDYLDLPELWYVWACVLFPFIVLTDVALWPVRPFYRIAARICLFSRIWGVKR